MTHEQVKDIIGFAFSEYLKDKFAHTEASLATAYLEAHPEEIKKYLTKDDCDKVIVTVTKGGILEFTEDKIYEAIKLAYRMGTESQPTQQQPPDIALRDRAEKYALDYFLLNYKGEYDESAITAMMKFAAEVAGEKDREIEKWRSEALETYQAFVEEGENLKEARKRIAELDKQVDLLQSVMADVKNENFVAALRRADSIIEEKNKLISEFQAEVKRLQDIEFRYNSVNK